MRAPAYHVTPAARRPWPRPLGPVATLAAAALAMLLPGGGDSASVWVRLAHWWPDSAHDGFAVATASLVGSLVWLGAEAVRQRRALRPALTAAMLAALLGPVALAPPLWPALLAAAALVALPVPHPRRAANDNPIPAHRTPHPFSLAA